MKPLTPSIMVLAASTVACRAPVAPELEPEPRIATAHSSIEVRGGTVLLHLFSAGDPEAEMEAFERWASDALRGGWAAGRSWIADCNGDGRTDQVNAADRNPVVVAWASTHLYEPIESFGYLDDLDGDGVREVRVNSTDAQHRVLYSASGTVVEVGDERPAMGAPPSARPVPMSEPWAIEQARAHMREKRGVQPGANLTASWWPDERVWAVLEPGDGRFGGNHSMLLVGENGVERFIPGR